MKLYTEEELEKMDFESDDDYNEELLNDDISHIKKPKFKRSKNWFSFKKRNKESKREEVLENDIPQVKESRFTKIKNKISSIRKNQKLRKEEKLQLREQGIYTKADKFKSFAKCFVQAAVSCVSFAGALVAATSVFTIGFLPAILIATGFVAASKVSNYLFKNELAEFKEIKNSFDLNNEKEEYDELIEENGITNGKEIKPDKRNVKNLKFDFKDLGNVKLTREQKIAKVKEECPLGYIKNLNTYLVFTPKKNVKLQRFITSEYKKQYPKEKIQSFAAGDKKILVLSQRPILK